MPLDEIASYINETSLFRNQWGYRPLEGETDARFKARVRAVLRQQLADARQSDVLRPAVAYGYFAANADGDDLVIWSDDKRSSELARLLFPRQDESPWLCIADFFRPLASGETDYVAFHVVTMGSAVSEETARLFAADRYGDYLHLHGLSVEMTEALAEYWHWRIRDEWGFAAEDGPSCAGPVPPAVPGRAATPGATRRARTWRTTPFAPRWWAPTASASSAARRPRGSSIPNRPRPPSSATTLRPSTSSSAVRRRARAQELPLEPFETRQSTSPGPGH